VPVTFDLRVLELLASRLCHDLVSPIGAVNTGMELLEESPTDIGAVRDAVSLAGGSARQASAVLQFYRAAYGQAGRHAFTDPAQLGDLADAFARARKSAVQWPPDPRWREVSTDATKLALNMVALGVESLPRGGTIAVGLDARRPLPSVRADGTGARVGEANLAAMAVDADPAELTPYTVHAHFTARLAEHVDARLTADGAGADTVVLRAVPRDD
jgi:histidine phosphotransferase ChpT